MSSNYKLGFIRSAPRTAAQATAAHATTAAQAQATAAQARAAPTPFASRSVTKLNRFSVNRLIHVKNSGGCRSCGS